MELRSLFSKDKISEKNFNEDCKELYRNTSLDESKKRATDLDKYTKEELEQIWDNDPGYISKYAMKMNSYYVKTGYHRNTVNYTRADVPGTKITKVIAAGAILKRYGSEYGKFLTDMDTPFEKLQLLYSEDKYKGRLTYYKVAQPFKVTESTIAQQFTKGKEGKAVDGNSKQYKLKGFSNVNDLVKKGYLIKLDSDSLGGMDMKKFLDGRESKFDNLDRGEKNFGSNKIGFEKRCNAVLNKFKDKFSMENKSNKDVKQTESKGNNKTDIKGENKGDKHRDNLKEKATAFMDKIKNKKIDKNARFKESDNKKEGEGTGVNQILQMGSEKSNNRLDVNNKNNEKKIDNKKDTKKASDSGNDDNSAEANIDKGREREREYTRNEKLEEKTNKEDEKKDKIEQQTSNNNETKQRFTSFQQLLENYKSKKEKGNEDKEDKALSDKREDPRQAFINSIKVTPEQIKAAKEKEAQAEKYKQEHADDNTREPGGRSIYDGYEHQR